MRIYPEGHAVCVIPSLVFTLRLDETFYAGIGAIGHAQLKFDLMGWSVTGEFRQAANLEYDEYTMQQLQMYEKVLERRREGHGDAGREEGYREDARNLDESDGAAVTPVT